MENKYTFYVSALTIVLTLSMFRLYSHDAVPKTAMKSDDISSMLGKPTVDTTVYGLHLNVWLITQKQHKKMMKSKMGKEMMGMKHDGTEMNKAAKEAMMAATHYFMLDIKDAATGKEIGTAITKVLIEFPSKKKSFIDLEPMMNHFGESLTLKEKGEYLFTVSMDVDGYVREKEFKYFVK